MDEGGLTQLGVTFQDPQTALQQLEVPLQVRGAGPHTQVRRQVKKSDLLFQVCVCLCSMGCLIVHFDLFINS